MKPGQAVIVKAFGGEELLRIVIQVYVNTVLICKPEEWCKAIKENRPPTGVGFPLKAVKKY